MGRFLRGFFVGMVLLAAVGVGVAWRQGWLGRSGDLVGESSSAGREAREGLAAAKKALSADRTAEEERARELRKWLSKGLEEELAGRWEEAGKAYAKALPYDGTNEEARVKRALMEARRGMAEAGRLDVSGAVVKWTEAVRVLGEAGEAKRGDLAGELSSAGREAQEGLAAAKKKALSADRAAAGALSEWARWWAMGEAAEKRDDPEAADAHYARARAALVEGLSSDACDPSDLSDGRHAECDAALAKCAARMAAKRAEAKRAIATLTGHKSAVWSVAFSPDGGTLASGSYDHAINLWGIRPLLGKPR